jgi:hypothetical protein
VRVWSRKELMIDWIGILQHIEEGRTDIDRTKRFV